MTERDNETTVVKFHSADTLPRRERNKQDRRSRILDAAEDLIRETGATDFSMALLAERAGLSGPTPYNLFGSKSGILYTLLNRSLDPVFTRQGSTRAEPDPIAHVLTAARIGADVFAEDPLFYRPLYQFLLGVGDPVHCPLFLDRSLGFWRGSLARLEAAGQMPVMLGRDQIARLIVTHFMGTLDLWVQSELNDDEFRAQIVYGVGVLLLGLANETQRSRLMARLRTLERRLPRGFAPSSRSREASA